jgi:hypothetical protein
MRPAPGRIAMRGGTALGGSWICCGRGMGRSRRRPARSRRGWCNLQYGYDRASNRTHRADLIAQFYEKDFDELYEYDGLHRLKKFHRGRLADGDAVIESPTLQQGWRLDATGNWRNFTQTDAGDPGQTLDQQRVANRVNEITQIARTVGSNWATPQYDRNGNMTVIPQPKAMTETYRAAWDAWNRLVKLEEPDGGDGWQTLAEYQYDGQTWRTLAKNYAAGELDETRHTYFSSQWQALEERPRPHAHFRPARTAVRVGTALYRRSRPPRPRYRRQRDPR